MKAFGFPGRVSFDCVMVVIFQVERAYAKSLAGILWSSNISKWVALVDINGELLPTYGNMPPYPHNIYER